MYQYFNNKYLSTIEYMQEWLWVKPLHKFTKITILIRKLYSHKDLIRETSVHL